MNSTKNENLYLLVKDESLYEGRKAPLYEWLYKEGFTRGVGYGYYNVNWVFIDIVSKVFKPGRPGVGFGLVIGNHAITIDEFKQIYRIYKKYEGLERLRMTMEEQKLWYEKIRIEQANTQQFWSSITLKNYIDRIEQILQEVYTGIPTEEIPDILKKNHDEVLLGFNSHISPSVIADNLFEDF